MSAHYGDAVRHGLTVVGTGGLLCTVIGRDEVTHTTPAPDAYLHAAGVMDVEPARCLAHEDADEGITAATRAGMPVIAIRDRPWQWSCQTGRPGEDHTSRITESASGGKRFGET
ncbi:HAD family hydrolase [Streptomyces longwoodensis]|uniref:HAD family hydrolase n=1 Tax=Streptomyces longwoodensis TaxID=68231 RepID=UPI00340CD42C